MTGAFNFKCKTAFDTLAEARAAAQKILDEEGKIGRSQSVTAPDAPDLRKGDRVRVLTGPFEGVEGVYVRMPNRHEKRVVIKIEGVAAVATMALNASDIEKI